MRQLHFQPHDLKATILDHTIDASAFIDKGGYNVGFSHPALSHQIPVNPT